MKRNAAAYPLWRRGTFSTVPPICDRRHFYAPLACLSLLLWLVVCTTYISAVPCSAFVSMLQNVPRVFNSRPRKIPRRSSVVWSSRRPMQPDDEDDNNNIKERKRQATTSSNRQDGQKKQPRAKQSSPRFSQQAHPVSLQPQRRSTKSAASPPPSRTTTRPPWKSRKSIEELEDTMTKRWGLGADQWTFDPQDYEIDGEDDDGLGTTYSSTGSVTSSSTSKRPKVWDPWHDDTPNHSKKTTRDLSSRSHTTFGSESSSDSNNNNNMDPMVHRVRRNQERFRRHDRTREIEYYDEDDEGYEARVHGNTKDDADSSGLYRLDHLISPRPVGGRGSNEIGEKAQERVGTPETEEQGFFFHPPGAQKNREDDLVSSEGREATAKSKPIPRRPISTPVLDENGEPLYLTVEQAKRDFESSLRSTMPEKDAAGSYVAPVTRSWAEVGVTAPQLLENLQTMGCKSPLAVQDKACPPVLTGSDVLVGTYTGSGKTLAFLAPLAQRLLFAGSPSNHNEVQVLIIAPGRELASQIVSVARSLLQGTGLEVMLSIGGTTFTRNLEQIRKRKPCILVGTPGRVAELVVGRPGEKSGRLKVSGLQTVVLDEFDALLEYKPHRDPTRAIMTTLKNRHGDALQSILCSATASDLIGSKKVETLLRPGYAKAMADRDDQLVTAFNSKSQNTRVSRTVIHGMIHVPQRRLAIETLRRILHTEPIPQQVLIFADSARRVDIVVEKLERMGIIAAPLHGGFGSEKADRAEVNRALREGYVGIVVCTELAARGIDAPLLTHVINLDLPTDASHYAHRAGRCGRGGRPGVVINITTDQKDRNVPSRFADSLGIVMNTVEARSGKLGIVEPTVAEADYDSQ